MAGSPRFGKVLNRRPCCVCTHATANVATMACTNQPSLSICEPADKLPINQIESNPSARHFSRQGIRQAAR